MLVTILFRTLGFGAIAYALWTIGPSIEYKGQFYLADEQTLLFVEAGLAGFWLISLVWSWLMVRRTNAGLLADLANDAEGEIDEEARVIAERFEQALGVLKNTTNSKGFLHELPWYIIIGPPGSGKTTALVNSGLRFPMKEHLGSEVIKGIGGTRNCDWWFTTDAVLIDTAGRYTTQDSHEEVDKAAWQNFMGLLKKFRPERPLNGVIVAVSLADIMTQDAGERTAMAQAVRSRMNELSESLGIRLPVYFMFTKCDLVAGFMEFFGNLNPNHRDKVWGETFGVSDKGDCDLDVRDYGDRFEMMIKRLNDQLLYRMHEETDVDSSLEMLGFPTQMASLKHATTDLLSEIFDPSFASKQSPLLRGVYYTSGTQAGTPIDRLLGAMASNIGIDNVDKLQYGGRGKSFFIKELLKEVIFPEANLAGVNRGLLRRRAFLKFSSFAVGVALVAVSGLAWLYSYNANSLKVSRVGELAEIGVKVGFNDLLEGADVTAIMEELDLLNEATRVFDNPAVEDQLGLYQGSALKPAATEAYSALLEKKLLPVAVARLEEEIITAINNNDPRKLNGLLKAYLMYAGINDNTSVDLDMDLLRTVVLSQWKAEFVDEPDYVDQIMIHFNALLAQGFAPVDLNRAIVREARNKLVELPVNQQLYQTLRQQLLRQGGAELKLFSLAGGKFAQVFKTRSGRSIDELKIPEMFTREGFYTKFVPAVENSSSSFATDAWVLGEHNTRELPTLDSSAVFNSYYDDYAREWNEVLLDLEIRDDGDAQQLITRLEAATSKGGVFEVLLKTIGEQTALPPADQATTEGERSNQIADQLSRQFGAYHDLATNEAILSRSLVSGIDLSVFLDQTLVNTLTSTPALSAVARHVEVGTQDKFVIFRSEMRRLPASVRGWGDRLYALAWKRVMAKAKTEVSAQWKNSVVAYYTTNLAPRYPFDKAATEDADLGNFKEFFGPNGRLKKFVNEHLTLFLSTGSGNWQEKSVDGETLGLDMASVAQLREVLALADVFYAPGAAEPSLSFTFRPVRLSDSAAKVKLSLFGEKIEYSFRKQPPTTVKWPPRLGEDESRLEFETLLGGDETVAKFGTWSAFRLIDAHGTRVGGSGQTVEMSLELKGMQADFEMKSQARRNIMMEGVLQSLKLPTEF